MFLLLQHCVHKQFLHSHVSSLAGTLIAAGLLLPWLASCSHFCTLLFLCCFGLLLVKLDLYKRSGWPTSWPGQHVAVSLAPVLGSKVIGACGPLSKGLADLEACGLCGGLLARVLGRWHPGRACCWLCAWVLLFCHAGGPPV